MAVLQLLFGIATARPALASWDGQQYKKFPDHDGICRSTAAFGNLNTWHSNGCSWYTIVHISVAAICWWMGTGISRDRLVQLMSYVCYVYCQHHCVLYRLWYTCATHLYNTLHIPMLIHDRVSSMQLPNSGGSVTYSCCERPIINEGASTKL